MSRKVRSLIKEWLSPLTEGCMTVGREGILDRLSRGNPIDSYRPDGVWLEEVSLNAELQQLQVVCLVPEPHYLQGDAMEYVSAEQLIRCYAQACGMLGVLLRESGNIHFQPDQSISSRSFFFADTNVRYRRPEPTGHPISFTLSLNKVIHRGGNIIYYFGIVSGSMTGRVTCFYSPDGSSQALPTELYDKLYFVWKSLWAELPKFRLNFLRLLARLIRQGQSQLPAPTTA